MTLGREHRWASIVDPDGGGEVEGIWIDVFKAGAVYVPKETEDGQTVAAIPLTMDLFADIISNFELMSSVGKPPKVQKAHEETGYNYGDVKAWRVDGEWLQAFITLKHPKDREAYNLGMIEQFSPGFHLNYMRTDTGERIGPHVFDVSFVTRAHQENLRNPKDINPGVFLGAQTIEEGQQMAEETTKFNAQEAFSAMAETLSAMGERLSAIEARFMADEEDAGAEEEEMSAEAIEAEKLSARILELEDANTRLELGAYDIDEDRAERLVALKRTDSVLFASMVQDLPVKQAPTIQAPIGAGGDGGGVSFSAMLDEAKAQGFKLGSAAFVGWAHTNHAKHADELVRFAQQNKKGGQ